jgi:hypothetical protein
MKSESIRHAHEFEENFTVAGKYCLDNQETIEATYLCFT